MSSFLNIVIAQLDFMVGDIDGNTSKIIETVERVRNAMSADVIVFPELTICGYPPEDLLLRRSLIVRSEKALKRIGIVNGIDLVIGMAAMGTHGLENQAVVIRAGNVICRYGKQYLPNYKVFDERRYFSPSNGLGLFECKGVKISLSICEDLWHSGPILASKKAEADLIISLNASPFHWDKLHIRHDMVRKRCRETGLPVVYTNLVGGQDELVFDGGSFAMNGSGELMVEACYFNEELCPVQFDVLSGTLLAGTKAKRPSLHA